MKVKTLRRFIDKETNAVHEVDSVFTCTEARFKEIKKAGNYIAPHYETKKDKKIITENIENKEVKEIDSDK